MSLWGKTDANTAAPKFVVNAATGGTGVATFGNTTVVGTFGVHTEEARAARSTKGATTPGWVARTVVGSRVRQECLVAFSGAASGNSVFGDASDDTQFPDIAIIAQPASLALDVLEATITVSAVSVPSGLTLAYQWEQSVDDGENWTDVTDAGVFSGATTATLVISDITGLDGNQYRAAVSGAGAVEVFSAAVTIVEA